MHSIGVPVGGVAVPLDGAEDPVFGLIGLIGLWHPEAGLPALDALEEVGSEAVEDMDAAGAYGAGPFRRPEVKQFTQYGIHGALFHGGLVTVKDAEAVEEYGIPQGRYVPVEEGQSANEGVVCALVL